MLVQKVFDMKSLLMIRVKTSMQMFVCKRQDFSFIHLTSSRKSSLDLLKTRCTSAFIKMTVLVLMKLVHTGNQATYFS